MGKGGGAKSPKWRFPHAVNARQAYLIEKMGLPCTVQYQKRGRACELRLQPEKGWLHLCPSEALAWFEEQGKSYHITVADAKALPDDPASQGQVSLGLVRDYFAVPRKTRVRVAWVSHETHVARVQIQDPFFQPMMSHLVLLRRRFGGHNCHDLTISM